MSTGSDRSNADSIQGQLQNDVDDHVTRGDVGVVVTPPDGDRRPATPDEQVQSRSERSSVSEQHQSHLQVDAMDSRSDLQDDVNDGWQVTMEDEALANEDYDLPVTTDLVPHGVQQSMEEDGSRDPPKGGDEPDVQPVGGDTPEIQPMGENSPEVQPIEGEPSASPGSDLEGASHSPTGGTTILTHRKSEIKKKGVKGQCICAGLILLLLVVAVIVVAVYPFSDIEKHSISGNVTDRSGEFLTHVTSPGNVTAATTDVRITSQGNLTTTTVGSDLTSSVN